MLQAVIKFSEYDEKVILEYSNRYKLQIHEAISDLYNMEVLRTRLIETKDKIKV